MKRGTILGYKTVPRLGLKTIWRRGEVKENEAGTGFKTVRVWGAKSPGGEVKERRKSQDTVPRLGRKPPGGEMNKRRIEVKARGGEGRGGGRRKEARWARKSRTFTQRVRKNHSLQPRHF